MKKLLFLLVTGAILTACGAGASGNDEVGVIRVGVVGAFTTHWDEIINMMAEEGIEIELVRFSDFMTPNRALDEGDIDLNAFQHKAFLSNDIAANNYQIQYIGETFIVPLNIFNNTSRISSMEDLAPGHTIGIPSDPTNSGRSLRLLETAGLITLDPSLADDAIPTVLDIVENISGINILEAESGMLYNMLPDMEAAVINGGNAFTAGLSPAYDSIFTEDITGDNVALLTNVIVARTADIEAQGQRMEVFEAIVQAHQSEHIRELILREYQGAFIPVW